MEGSVGNYSEAKKALFDYFKCGDEYFVNVLSGLKWQVTQDDGIYFLSYWNNNGEKILAVVIQKREKPQIFKAKKHTMVIAIDCVKIAFILDNNLKIK